MTFEAAVLGISAAVFALVALQGLFLPTRIVEPLGASLSTTSLANEIRANYGGMHAGIAFLLALAAARPEWRAAGLLLLATFTGGLCVGRFVSLATDGTPNRYVQIFLAIELVGAMAACALLLIR
jgi:hypothetical protein